jgi:hypothetical protein
MFAAMAISAFLVTANILVQSQSADRGARLLCGTYDRGMVVCWRILTDLQSRPRIIEGRGRRALRRFSLLLCDIVFHNGDRGRLSVRRTPPDLRYRGNQRSVPDRVVDLVHLLCDGSALAFAPRSEGEEMKGAETGSKLSQPIRGSSDNGFIVIGRNASWSDFAPIRPRLTFPM